MPGATTACDAEMSPRVVDIECWLLQPSLQPSLQPFQTHCDAPCESCPARGMGRVTPSALLSLTFSASLTGATRKRYRRAGFEEARSDRYRVHECNAVAARYLAGFAHWISSCSRLQHSPALVKDGLFETDCNASAPPLYVTHFHQEMCRAVGLRRLPSRLDCVLSSCTSTAYPSLSCGPCCLPRVSISSTISPM